MNKLPNFILPLLLLFTPLLTADCQHAQTRTASQSPATSAEKPVYETRANHDPDGIGKFYMGREIAHVMGYQGAEWLERPERIEEERPDQVVEQMKLKPTDVVADVGAGTGYFSFRISSVVKQGKVFAVDIQPEMLAIIEKRKKQLKADNVIAVKSVETNAELPENSIDVALMVDVYHEFAFPREMMLSVIKGLKPGGRLVQIEYRGEDPDVPIKRLHKMTVAQARKEMAAVGLVWKETKSFLPQQHFIVYEKPARQ
jgi:ubiquinone/menaquinone biosynthesis C-methylase UbiE